MKRISRETLYLPRMGQPARRVIVERRDLSHKIPVILDSIVIDIVRDDLDVCDRPIARELHRLLKDAPVRFPRVLTDPA